MGEECEKFIFLEDEATEVTFAHDESDIEEEVDLQSSNLRFWMLEL